MMIARRSFYHDPNHGKGILNWISGFSGCIAILFNIIRLIFTIMVLARNVGESASSV